MQYSRHPEGQRRNGCRTNHNRLIPHWTVKEGRPVRHHPPTYEKVNPYFAGLRHARHRALLARLRPALCGAVLDCIPSFIETQWSRFTKPGRRQRHRTPLDAVFRRRLAERPLSRFVDAHGWHLVEEHRDELEGLLPYGFFMAVDSHRDADLKDAMDRFCRRHFAEGHDWAFGAFGFPGL